MNYSIHTNPFLHLTIKDLITESENNELYEYFISSLKKYESSINDYSFFILDKDKHLIEKNGLEWCIENNILKNSITLDTIFDFPETIKYIKNKIVDRLNSLHAEIKDKFPIVKVIDNNKESEFGWSISFSLTNDKEILYPHTDSVEQICYESGITDEFEIKNSKLPRYRGILYVGNPNYEYKDYGTKYYISNPKISPQNTYLTENNYDPINGPNLFKVSKEIKFKPGESHIFKVSEDSFHGTDFISGFNYKRIFSAISYGFDY